MTGAGSQTCPNVFMALSITVARVSVSVHGLVVLWSHCYQAHEDGVPLIMAICILDRPYSWEINTYIPWYEFWIFTKTSVSFI